MLDMQGELGVLAPGAFADVVAVRGDPLRDLGELSRVQFVMKGGSVFRNDLRSANELSPARQEGPRATALPKAP
jgi:imidazolonepropionase-like amidohydrolase